MDALLRRRAMIAAGGGEPPTPHVLIPYIRGGADGSYIDTGITPDNTTKIIVWARNFNPAGVGYTRLFGSRIAYQNSMFSIVADSNQQTGSIGICYGGNALIDVTDAWVYMSHYRKYELSADGLFVDDVLINAIPEDSFASNISIHLFGENTNGSHTDTELPIDICACKIYKGGVLVRDYSAVNSSQMGLYDAVSGSIFQNAGSGSFSYGTFDTEAYMPLEFIECTSEQYFDSGLYGGYSLPVLSKLMPTSSTPDWYGIMGIFRNSPAQCCGFSLGTATSGQDNAIMYFRVGPNITHVKCFSGNASNKLTNKAVVVRKTNNEAYVYYNQSQIGTGTRSGVDPSFVTDETFVIGGTRSSGTTFTDVKFYGRFYFVGFGAQKNFVPAKVGAVAGMYDTYNDVFKPSETDEPFLPGPGA